LIYLDKGAEECNVDIDIHYNLANMYNQPGEYANAINETAPGATETTETAETAEAIILTHHEKSNGSGYPMGLTYDKIHECSRIVSIADIYDAMTSDRVYRRRINPSEVVEYIVVMTYEWFDLRTVESFRRCIAPYPLGTYVRLSTGDIAIVSGINNIMPTRPQVRIVEPCRGQMYRNVTIDLMRELSINIVDTEA